MITRRCTQRQLLMRPDEETNNAFVYCLGEAAARHGVQVIFTVANSNHHHTGIFDRDGNFPAFIERFHKLFAKCQNALRGRTENFWSSEQTSVVRLIEPADVLAKMTYALTNPVKDGLVERTVDWPGVNAFEAIIMDRPLTADRPLHFFREDGDMPAKVVLHFSRPVGFEELPHATFAALVEENVNHAEEMARRERVQSGVRVLGRAGVLRQDWQSRPHSTEARRSLKPEVAARNKWRRVEAILRNKAFRDAYAAARRAFNAGLRDVMFPAGTYWLRHFAQVQCAPHPAT
jgi:putative transposase